MHSVFHKLYWKWVYIQYSLKRKIITSVPRKQRVLQKLFHVLMVLFLQLLFSDISISQILFHTCAASVKSLSIHFLPSFAEVAPTDLNSLCFYAVPAIDKTLYQLLIQELDGISSLPYSINICGRCSRSFHSKSHWKKVGKGCIKILSMVLRIQVENRHCHFIKTLW